MPFRIPGINGSGHRDYQISKPSFFRRIVMESYDIIPPAHNIMALTEFDVTDVRKALRMERKNGSKGSLLAYIIKAIAVAVDENRELNSSRNGSGSRVVVFRDVDINMPVEVNAGSEKIPRRIVIRKANEKSVEAICTEIDRAKKQGGEPGIEEIEQKKALKLAGILFKLPKFIRTIALRKIINNPITVNRMDGTVFITSLGMFGSIPGYAIPYIIGHRAAAFALGSVVRKPVVRGEEILIREVLSMSLVFNHDLVDGAPAARFTNRLKKLIENREILALHNLPQCTEETKKKI